jgi:uncharacterized membrane protein YfcA
VFAGLADTFAQVGFMHLGAIWLVVVFAAVMRAFTGFGFALTAVPVFSLFMIPTQAVVLSALLGLAVNLLTVKTYWGKYPLKPLLPMIGFAVVGTVLGTALLASVSSQAFQLSIGVSVIAASLALTFYRPGHKEAGLTLNSLTGLASGCLNGAFAIPGPPVIIFAMATQPDPLRSRALLMTFFLFSAIAALLSYSVAGFVTISTGWLFAMTFPAMFAGDKLGYYLFNRYGTSLYRTVALVVLFSVGAAITAKALL